VTANVRRLQPLRILLCGRDRRFLRVTSFLLARRGYDVAQASIPEAVNEAERHRSDIVVLEPAESRVDTARTIAALQACTASPGLLVVFDAAEKPQWNGLPTAHKWIPIDELIDQIEAAALQRIPPAVAAMLAAREGQL
jgi:CheY-like chemotaxis protein